MLVVVMTHGHGHLQSVFGLFGALVLCEILYSVSKESGGLVVEQVAGVRVLEKGGYLAAGVALTSGRPVCHAQLLNGHAEVALEFVVPNSIL